MNPTAGTVQRLSNEEFISGGIYPGGTGIIKNIRYSLWDYGGKQPPDSQVAVKCDFHPTDGSNEGEDVEIYWSVGPSTNFVPEHMGRYLIPVQRSGKEMAKGISDNCNWKQAYTAFQGCGLAKGAIDSDDKGIHTLIGTEVVFTRVDQKERDFADNTPAGAPGGQGGQQRKKGQILVPTRCKFPWDKAGRSIVQGAAAPAPHTAAGTAAPAAASAPAASNGAATGDQAALLSQALQQALAVNQEGLAPVNLTAAVTAELTKMGVSGANRAKVIKLSKDQATLNAIIATNGWSVGEAADDMGTIYPA